MAGSAVKLSATSARALLAASPLDSPMASLEAATATSGELVMGWLKITAVPLLVFLIGACIWGCIKNTTAWRTLTEGGGEIISARNSEAGEVAPADSSRPIDNNRDAQDLETGRLELSQVGNIDDACHVSVDSKCTATDAYMDGRLAPTARDFVAPSSEDRPAAEN